MCWLSVSTKEVCNCIGPSSKAGEEVRDCIGPSSKAGKEQYRMKIGWIIFVAYRQEPES